jgi:hypothetical protein
LRAAAEAAEQVSQKLWFLDLKFEQFATPRLIGILYTATLIGMVLFAFSIAAYFLYTEPALKAAFIIVFDVIVLAFMAIALRVFLECCLLGFKIAEHLSHLRHLAKDE